MGMKRSMLLATAVLLLGFTIGCGTEKFVIRYNRKPKLDIPPRIKRVAIVGFTAKQDYGDIVTGKLAAKIRESGRFKIYDRESLKTIMDEKDLIESGLADTGAVKDLKLGAVDAMIVGEVRAMTQIVDYEETRYKVQNVGGYPMPVPYKVTIKVPVYELSLKIKMIDVTSKARVIAAQSYSKSHHPKRDRKQIDRIRKARGKKGVTPQGIFEVLIDDCVSDFCKLIIPYKVELTVKLMKGSGLINTGVTFLKGSNVEDAEECFKTVLETEPNKIEALYNLAVCYEVSGRLLEARKLYKKCILLKGGEHRPSAEGINRITAELKRQQEEEKEG